MAETYYVTVTKYEDLQFNGGGFEEIKTYIYAGPMTRERAEQQEQQLTQQHLRDMEAASRDIQRMIGGDAHRQERNTLHEKRRHTYYSARSVNQLRSLQHEGIQVVGSFN